MKYKHIITALALLFVTLTSCSQSKTSSTQTVYSDTACRYVGQDHLGDIVSKMKLIVTDSTISFVAMSNDSAFVAKIGSLSYFAKLEDGSTVSKYNGTLRGESVILGVMKDKDGVIVAVSISNQEADGLIFLIVPKAVLPNKNTTLDVTN